MEQLRIVLLGEVDSGKSTLIGRLLYDTNSLFSQVKEEFEKTCQRLERGLEFAYLLDSFEEERTEEFTLDTTQAFFRFKDKEFLLIDVPGHRELLKNMLTGSSYAEAAVLVIDVKKSIEEQTRRHLFILKFLGIDEVIVVINKMDLVSYEEDYFIRVKKQIIEFLAELGIKVGYVIPVSAKEGENLVKKPLGMGWYKELSLAEALSILERKGQIYDFRFPIQDIYEFGKEKMAVGRIISGKIKKGDLLKVAPLDMEIKVKGIKIFDKSANAAKTGENIGLVFYSFQNRLKRGYLLYKGSTPKANRQIKTKIFCLHQLGVQGELLLKIATQEIPVKISAIEETINTVSLGVNKNANVIKAAEAAIVIITAEKPFIIEKFHDLPELGRFILEKNNIIYAVGIIC